jgi:hypothetical protein
MWIKMVKRLKDIGRAIDKRTVGWDRVLSNIRGNDMAVTLRNGIVLGLSIALNWAAWAEPQDFFEGEVEYRVPVSDSSFKSFSLFKVSKFVVTKDEFGSFSIDLDLPRDLTAGKTISVNLVQSERDGHKISFTKDIGTAECLVPQTWETAKCTYRFNDQFKALVPLDEANKYLNQKYKNDGTLEKRKQVALNQFLKSTDPIGEAFPRAQSCLACSQGNGVWDIQYTTPNGNQISSVMELVQKEGRYFNKDGSGSLSQVIYQGNIATGTWKYGNSTGWFEFKFEGDTFDGSWGNGRPGTPKVGRWTGSRLE